MIVNTAPSTDVFAPENGFWAVMNVLPPDMIVSLQPLLPTLSPAWVATIWVDKPLLWCNPVYRVCEAGGSWPFSMLAVSFLTEVRLERGEKSTCPQPGTAPSRVRRWFGDQNMFVDGFLHCLCQIRYVSLYFVVFNFLRWIS
jgi:hypothetical protein